MNIRMNTLTAGLTLVCAAALFACSGGKGSKAVTTADGTTIEVPKDIHYYTNGERNAYYDAKERKSKKQIESEALGFKLATKQFPTFDVKEGEFQGNEHIKEIYITDHCVNIAPYAFANCTNLEKIVSTSTIDVVNDDAFENCTSLKALDNDIRTIGLSTFANCTSLESFISTDNIYWVRDSAFLNCTSLKTVILGITLTKFEDAAFEGCTAVEEISIPAAWKLHMFNVYQSMPNLKKVYLLTTEPYAFPENSKDFNCEQVDLYVPDMFLQNFKDDASWARFKSINPLSQTEYFNEMGARK